jgi:sulfhydrogenase subunit beta (sulfur reductase)
VDAGADEPPRYAFLGARSCDLHAMDIQDKVFLDPSATDPTYASGRNGAFVIAVNCGVAGGTCFCVSMETGPKATDGFDLALTELLDADRHEFLIEVGSEAGAELLATVPARDARAADTETAARIVEHTAASMGRSMDTHDIRDLLAANLEHPRWDDVAERCLSCTNCTLVCPTCFCSSVEDVTDLAGENAERWRVWDSCFTADHSYLHGGSVRPTIRSRYRQWLTHKLGTWIDQFGTSGCVGCGRCITWCPVGIDLTEEVRAIRQAPSTSGGGSAR